MNLTGGEIIAGLILIAIPFIGLAVKSWIKEKIKQGVKAQYTTELEHIKAGYATALEQVKAQMKTAGELSVEKYKHELKAAHDVAQAATDARNNAAIVTLQAELTRQASKLNTNFTQLAARRFEAVAKVYGALHRHYFHLRDYTSAFQPVGVDRDAQHQAVINSGNAALDAFLDHQVFFPIDVEEKMEALRMEMVKCTNIFYFMVEMNKGQPSAATQRCEIEEKVNGPILDGLREIRGMLRKAMGESAPV